ncbi:MAG: DUF3575 domain-containing protein [Flavobacteriia bacterium]|nr:DUF3575 domain-containing protein [Flavobacteriia bacterium]MBH2024689.1 DUF3575 domain-containing protein [Flavobacteriales bacterium]
MKKLLLPVAIFCLIVNLHAQETEVSDRRNDIMISPIELIAGPVLNVSYERLINENSGVGLNGLFYLGSNNDDYRVTQISPYYRMYFGKKYAAGFFVEGFAPITMTTDTYYDFYVGPGYNSSTPQEESNTTIGLGFGFGGKWVARKNILFEASMGIARRFGIDEKYDAAITGKGMLGIGYRF